MAGLKFRCWFPSLDREWPGWHPNWLQFGAIASPFSTHLAAEERNKVQHGGFYQIMGQTVVGSSRSSAPALAGSDKIRVGLRPSEPLSLHNSFRSAVPGCILLSARDTFQGFARPSDHAPTRLPRMPVACHERVPRQIVMSLASCCLLCTTKYDLFICKGLNAGKVRGDHLNPLTPFLRWLHMHFATGAFQDRVQRFGSIRKA